MNKKAVTMTLTRMILFIVTAILIFASLVLIISKFNEGSPDELCRTDVAKQILIKNVDKANLNLHIGLPNCKNWQIHFYNDKVERYFYENEKINNKHDVDIKLYSGQSFDKFKKLDDDIVNYVVAEELANCWWRFHEAKKKIFLDNAWYTNDWDDDNEACFVCGTMQFDLDVKQEKFEGFYDFIQFMDYKKDVTYYDYVINNTRVCDQYVAEGNTDAAPDACWHLFRLGVDYQYVFLPMGTGGSIMLPDWFNLASIDAHPEFDTDIVFDKNQMYHIVLVRMGDDDTQTYASWVVPVGDLGTLCNKVAV